ncbi:hypothetical protein N8I77_010957 [Diaporthe amygdali]|uniref:Uncharacterized protein n=1 Tax=Phomopsis amygdali TaxID=1214568 RepID=A0AAD9W1K1_PHOAM|nr:hypothetical protein N8I77_010957 [Diaporthe amygdali]
MHITDPVVSEVFMIDPLFNLERTDKQSEDAWLAYESRFVEIHDPEQYGLPPSTQLVEGGPHAYSLAAYHQLHCLAVVRFAWHTLLNNGSAALEQPFPGQAHFSEGYTIGSHMGHCVEIIRHALTCYADATLEPLFQEDGIHPSKEIASGWGVHHTCRNLDSLTSWADSKSIHIYAKGDLNG